jgi:hypothetical protein
MKVIFSIVVLTLLPHMTMAARAYIGNTNIKAILNIESSGHCSPNGGSCLRIVFDEGALGCDAISIDLNSPRIEDFKAMALVSYTTGKSFRVYASTEFCDDKDKIGINSIELK